LKKGYHTFKLGYFNGVGEAGLQLQYSVYGSGEKPLPSSFLYYTK
jgi:hypothetical protein